MELPIKMPPNITILNSVYFEQSIGKKTCGRESFLTLASSGGHSKPDFH